MGIRVDEESLMRQLKLAGCEERARLPFQKAILDRELPYTIGGGIGQSRICMYYLRKAISGRSSVPSGRTGWSKKRPKKELCCCN